MTPPPRPSPCPSLGPERLAELLDDAVRDVTAQAGALDRIRRGVRRRRTARRAGVALLAVTVLAGGSATALAVTSGPGPVPALQAASPATAQRTPGMVLASADQDVYPPPPVKAMAPMASPSAGYQAGQPSLSQPSLSQPAGWDIGGFGQIRPR